MLTEQQLNNNSLPEYWCVQNDGSQLFKDTVVAYLNERCGANLCGGGFNHFYGYGGWLGRELYKRDIKNFMNKPTLLTLPKFINLLNTPKMEKTKQEQIVEILNNNALKLVSKSINNNQVVIELGDIAKEIAAIYEPEPPKPLTLLEVYEKVNPVCYLNESLRQLNAAPTEADAGILGIHMMLNVLAVYLNGEWKPDYKNNNQDKYQLVYDNGKEILKTTAIFHTWNNGIASFATPELVMEAVAMIDAYFGKDYVLNAFKKRVI